MDETIRILKMVEDGTVTAEQAAELMAAMGVSEKAGQLQAQHLVESSEYDKRMFRIIVDSVQGDKVNIQFPTGAVRRILNAAGKLPVSDKTFEGMDVGEIMSAVSQCLEEEVEGDFVNVDAADGTKVRIFVE